MAFEQTIIWARAICLALNLYRKSNFLFGLNIDVGRIGHGSALEKGVKGTEADGNNFEGKVRRDSYKGIGSLSVFNILMDFGVNMNNLLLAAGGTGVAYNEATSFLSFNLGYSIGFGIVGAQRFENPENSIQHYNQLNTSNQNLYQRDNTYFEDPRNSKAGFVGGSFISCDIGHASARMQWYRYRRSPVAKGLVFFLAWRIG